MTAFLWYCSRMNHLHFNSHSKCCRVLRVTKQCQFHYHYMQQYWSGEPTTELFQWPFSRHVELHLWRCRTNKHHSKPEIIVGRPTLKETLLWALKSEEETATRISTSVCTSSKIFRDVSDVKIWMVRYRPTLQIKDELIFRFVFDELIFHRRIFFNAIKVHVSFVWP